MAFDARKYWPHIAIVKGKLFLEGDAYASPNAVIDLSGNVTIHKGVVLSHWVHIYTHVHRIPPRGIPIRKAWKEVGGIKARDLIIEEDVWLADYVVVLPSCNRIGKGSIIGARAVLTKDVPPFEIWAGNTARKIGERI